MNNDTTLQCAFCGAANGHLRLCGACKSVRYCCTEHQHQHWKTHKIHCSKLKNSKVVSNDSKISNQPRRADLPVSNSLLESFGDESYRPKSLQYFNGQTSQEPDYSTPIDVDSGVDNSVSKDNDQSLFQLELSPDNNSVSKELGEEWLANVTGYLLRDLNSYGFCAVDNFLGGERARKVVEEVNAIHDLGLLTDGQVVSRNVHDQARGMVRGDKITWVNGTEKGCETISQLISSIDSVISNANKHHNAGKLADFDITLRTRAMVACYPGGGTHYVKHVDNPNGDGRCVTAIYYLNENWSPQKQQAFVVYQNNFKRCLYYRGFLNMAYGELGTERLKKNQMLVGSCEFIPMALVKEWLILNQSLIGCCSSGQIEEIHMKFFLHHVLDMQSLFGIWTRKKVISTEDMERSRK